MGLPATSVTPVVIVAVYVVEYARGPDGVNVAVVPLYDTVPVTPLTVKVVLFIVAEVIASLNVAVMALPTAIFTPPLTGLVALTIGGIISDPVPSLNRDNTSPALSALL